MSEENKMMEASPSKALRLMKTNIKAGRVPMLLGGVGVGKSATVSQLAEVLAGDRKVVETIRPKKDEYGFIDFRASLYETIELGGLPFIEKGEQKRAFLGNLPVANEGLLFIDEFAQATADMQKLLGQLVNEKKLGEYHLPEGWDIVMAGNRASDRSGANKLLAHMSDRVSVYHFKHDVNDWLVWGSENGVHPSILGFINFMPKLLWKFDAKDSNPQPSPRSWTRLSDIMKAETDKDLMPFHAQGNVGIEAGLEFMNFITLSQDIPNLADIVDGKEVDVPEGLGLQYATAVALVSAIQDADDKLKPSYFDNALKWMDTFPSKEFPIFFGRAVVGAVPDLKNTKTFSVFNSENKDVLI